MDKVKTELVKFGLPSKAFLDFKNYGNTAVPQSPFENEFLSKIFYQTMKVQTPMTIALVYFSLVHYINPLVTKRQQRKAALAQNEKQTKTKTKTKTKGSGSGSGSTPRLAPAPFKFTKTVWFRLFVILHNAFLCGYSVWTFYVMIQTINSTQELMKLHFEKHSIVLESNFQKFFQTICDVDNGIFNLHLPFKNLLLMGWLFYVSKFYEVLDTVIILVKGKPSSLLQSYHHAGAMMCMWGGIRYQSPPIWIFVVFNSFIHSLMYFYFTLSCLKIRVPTIFKRVLTSLQITQFVVGGSLALLHGFIWFTDTTTNKLINCIATPDQALPLIINVSYLTPLTGLFAAFYIESYIKSK